MLSIKLVQGLSSVLRSDVDPTLYSVDTVVDLVHVQTPVRTQNTVAVIEGSTMQLISISRVVQVIQIRFIWPPTLFRVAQGH